MTNKSRSPYPVIHKKNESCSFKKNIIKITSLSVKLFLKNLDHFRILLGHFCAQQIKAQDSLNEILYYYYCSYDDAQYLSHYLDNRKNRPFRQRYYLKDERLLHTYNWLLKLFEHITIFQHESSPDMGDTQFSKVALHKAFHQS